jgi:hypothetical protein
MSPEHIDGVREPSPDVSADELIKYNIKRVSVDFFHYQGFRYTNLKDAVAQARRDQRAR